MPFAHSPDLSPGPPITSDGHPEYDRSVGRSNGQTHPASRISADVLEKLSCNSDERYSVKINDQYRVCFVWQDDDAYDVEITDYH